MDAAAPSEKAQNFFAALAAFAKMEEERVAPTTRTAKTRKPTTDEKESTVDQGNRTAVADSRSADGRTLAGLRPVVVARRSRIGQIQIPPGDGGDCPMPGEAIVPRI